MRQKRAKAYRRLMALYSMSFGFRQPYQVLIDSEMCKFACESQIDFIKQLGIVLQGSVKPMITQCCIHALYLQGKSQQPAVDLAKTFERRKCNHREVIPEEECLASVIGDSNKHRYIVATQLASLRATLRSVPAVPVIHVNRSVIVLEPPSDATLKMKEMNEEEGLHASGADKSLIPSAPTEPPRKKRKGPKGPNPLSVKKKAKVNPVPHQKAKYFSSVDATKGSSPPLDNQSGDNQSGDKRKRQVTDITDREHPDDAADEHRDKPKRKRRRKEHGKPPESQLQGD